MAVSGSLKIPPPPVFAKTDPAFNRWLLEVTAILAAAGGIDPTQIAGWNELVAQVATDASNITALQGNVGSLNSTVATQGATIATNTSNITTLQSRNQPYSGTVAPAVGLGIDGDWYYNRTGAAGARLYIKVAGAWAAQAI